MHEGRVITHKDGVDVIACEQCQYTHIMPLPTPEAIKALYERQFYAETKPEYIEKMARESEYWTAIYTERLDKMDELTSYKDEPYNVLDVGCGPGYFLTAAVDDGWQAEGIELSKQAAEHARQFAHVSNVAVEDVDLPHGYYRAIHCSFLLEHLVDPLAVLKKLHAWLVPGGVLCVEVPRDFSMSQYYVPQQIPSGGKLDWWVAPKEGHVNYFNESDIMSLLIRAGFKPCYQTTTFPMEAFLVGGQNYLGNPEVGSECHKQRMALEMYMYQNCPELKKGLYELMAAHELGREILVYARREDS